MTVSESTTISFEVLGKTYTLSCADEESDSLRRAVVRLNEYVERMNRDLHKQYVTPDRLLVAVAVNIVDLYMKQDQEIASINERVKELTASIREFSGQADSKS